MIIPEGRLVVRWYDPSDLPQLHALHVDCWPHEPWPGSDLDDFRKHTGKIKILAGEPGSACAGTVLGSMLYSGGPKQCRLERLAIRRSHRRQGLGRFLLNTLIGPRNPSHCRVVEVLVPEYDLDAQLFFRSLGFTARSGKTVPTDDLGPALLLQFVRTRVRDAEAVT